MFQWLSLLLLIFLHDPPLLPSFVSVCVCVCVNPSFVWIFPRPNRHNPLIKKIGPIPLSFSLSLTYPPPQSQPLIRKFYHWQIISLIPPPPTHPPHHTHSISPVIHPVTSPGPGIQFQEADEREREGREGEREVGGREGRGGRGERTKCIQTWLDWIFRLQLPAINQLIGAFNCAPFHDSAIFIWFIES